MPLPIMVSQAFADAVLAWDQAVALGGAAASGEAWKRVALHGMTGLMRTHAERVIAAEAVLNGEAIIFGGSGPILGGMAGETGATLIGAGIGVGLAVSAAALVVVGGCLIVHHKNKRDFESTKRDALYIYFRQYWPRYVKFAMDRQKQHPGFSTPQPLTFQEFFAHRDVRIVNPAHF